MPEYRTRNLISKAKFIVSSNYLTTMSNVSNVFLDVEECNFNNYWLFQDDGLSVTSASDTTSRSATPSGTVKKRGPKRRKSKLPKVPRPPFKFV